MGMMTNKTWKITACRQSHLLIVFANKFCVHSLIIPFGTVYNCFSHCVAGVSGSSKSVWPVKGGNVNILTLYRESLLAPGLN